MNLEQPYSQTSFAPCLQRWIDNFYRVHKELESENWSKGVPIEEHVKMVSEKMKQERTWLDNEILVILFWPFYLLYVKKYHLADLGNVLEELIKK